MPTPLANAWFAQEYYQEIPDGLWRLDDALGSMTADDISVNSNPAVAHGGVTFQVAGFPSDLDKAATLAGGTAATDVAVRSSSSNTDAVGSSSVSVSAPAGTVAGDVVIIVVHANNSPTITDNNGSTPFTKDVADETQTSHTVSVFSRRIQSGDPSTYNFALTSSERWTIEAVAFSNPNLTTIYDVSPVVTKTLSGASINAASITTLTNKAIHVAVGMADGSTASITGTPAGYTVDQNTGSMALAVCHKVITTAGSTGAQTFTPDATRPLMAISFAIKSNPASNGGYLDVGAVSLFDNLCRFTVSLAFLINDGSGSTALLSKTDWLTDKGFQVLIDTGKPRFKVTDAAGSAIVNLVDASTRADGFWHHLVAVYDSALTHTAVLYIDGTQVASGDAAAGRQCASSGWKLLLGAADGNDAAVRGFSASGFSLDEVAIYPYAFTAAQVTALFGARQRTMSQKAATQMRAGIARSAAARSFFYTSRNIVLLNGVDVSAKVWKGTLKTKEILNEQPDTATLTLFDRAGTLNPSYGNTIILSDGAPDNRYFGGNAVRVRRRSTKRPAGLGSAVALWDINVTDWTWLLNRRTVTKAYPAGTLAHVAFTDIITNNTTGFTTRNVKTSAPALAAALAFKGAKVATALSRIASATPGWSWYPDSNCDLHFAPSETSQRPKAIVPGNTTYDQLDYTLDITQIRTRCIGEGGGAATTAPVSAGATSAPVEDCGWYAASGGQVVSPEGDIITYTGVSVASGPGNVTGIPASGAGSITQAIKQGEILDVWVVVNDTAAQTTLGLLERDQNGATTDGIHEQYLAFPNATIAMVTQSLNAELAAYKNANVLGTLWSRDRLMKPGKILTITLPIIGINIDVTVQQVARSLLTVNSFQCEVTFATTWRNFIDVLKRVTRT